MMLSMDQGHKQAGAFPLIENKTMTMIPDRKSVNCMYAGP